MGQPCVKAFLRCIKSLSPVPAGYQKGGCNFTSRRNQCKAMDGAGYFTGYGAFRSHLGLKLLYPNLQRLPDLGELILEKGCDEGREGRAVVRLGGNLQGGGKPIGSRCTMRFS